MAEHDETGLDVSGIGVLTEAEEKAIEELIWELSAPHSCEEIAKRLGVSRKTIWKHETKAIDKMGKILKKERKDWSGGLKDPIAGGTRANTRIREKS